MLDFRSTDQMVVLFWDKPEEAGADASYTVQAAGRTLTVGRTHCTIEGLEPESAFEAIVCLDGGGEIGRLPCRTGSRKKRLSVRDFGAAGDGVTNDRQALQRAIDACDAEHTLFFPAGTYLTGALRLHSHMDIYLEKDAVIQGTADPKDYLPKIHSRFEGYELECYQSLINMGDLDHTAGPNCENIVLRGEGTIYGGGRALMEATEVNRERGRLIQMNNTKGVWIHGLTLGYGASWNVHFIYSDDIVTDACTFRSEGVWNGDGWDPDSSTNATVFDCRFYTEDDCVAIKSGKNPEGNRIARPSKHIRVFDCQAPFGHGLCIGSEMSGGIEDVRLWDCEMGPTWSGIEVKATRKRGGYVRDVHVRDCTASHIMIHSVGYNDDGEAALEPPVFEDMRFERIHLLSRFLDNNAGRHEWHDCPPIEVRGFDLSGHEARNIHFRDITAEEPAMSNVFDFCRNVTVEGFTTEPRESTLRRQALFEKIKGRLIVSCQAVEGEPLYDPDRSLMGYMALAAKQAGSVMIRTSSVRDVLAVKEMTGLPVIGLIKIQYEGFDRYITPTMREVDALTAAGADIIAIDCTDQKRGDGKTVEEFIREVRMKYPDQILMADISTFEEGVRAEKLGMDLVGTTMSGYTPQSPRLEGPDYELVRRLSRTLHIPVIGEGRIHTPEQAVQMLEQGAFAIVVGGAITRPLEIASRFIKAVSQPEEEKHE